MLIGLGIGVTVGDGKGVNVDVAGSRVTVGESMIGVEVNGANVAGGCGADKQAEMTNIKQANNKGIFLIGFLSNTLILRENYESKMNPETTLT